MSASGGVKQVCQTFTVQSLWDLGVSSGFSRTAALQGLPGLKRISLAPSQHTFFLPVHTSYSYIHKLMQKGLL